ncbi:MAG: biosynthetic-type acetolactate synthase large subunit [Chloroflexi bacterium]|nr:biosynthetic-type acetolactate synthase large subunit [Chloroflexota bacterium]
MKLSGAQMLCECLVREGVVEIFGFPGGTVLPLYDVWPQYPQLRHVLVRHEQGAAHMADGYARATGRVGVCVATSGPGACNLVTGIATAHMDSSPVVAITGQVVRSLIGKDGFQECDITGITLPITKYNYLVLKAADIPRVVKEAFHIARTGRPGPVLIDIPRDVFTEEAEYDYPDSVDLPGYKPTLTGHPTQIRKAASLINQSLRPVIIVGHGVVISRAYTELRDLAEKAQAPVTPTLLGISSFPGSHVLSLGMLGMHGTYQANRAVTDADLIIGLGMRFDDRATGKVSEFAPKAKIIHIDIDPAEIGKNVRVDVPIVGDVAAVLRALNGEVQQGRHTEWLAQIDDWRESHASDVVPDSEKLLPQQVVSKLYEVTRGEATIVTGVGQNQMWAARFYRYDRSDAFISSGGLGTMGFELPAGIGVKMGRPQDAVWCVCGDGGFQMTMEELAVAVQEKVAIKVAILNNGFLGMVRQWQDLFFGKRFVATPLLGPDFVKIAEAYGILGLRATRPSEVGPAIERAMEHDGPVVVDFAIQPEENVYPMVPPGGSIGEMLEAPQPVRSRSSARGHRA